MKKVLIITYYWPPSGGVGVQRWLKFAKYLPKYGWEPIIFTPENPDFELHDKTLIKDISEELEVLKFPIWEPFGIYKKLFKNTSKKNLKQGIIIEKTKLTLGDKLTIWVRANLFIPDPRRFWIKPSVTFLKDYIVDNDIQHIITTGPPHSMHLIGLGLKKNNPNLKWVADFRDPWSDWDVLNKLKISNLARKIHKKIEANVMRNCNVLITVSNRLAISLRKKGFSKNVKYITNGYDESDFLINSNKFATTKFRILYTGLLNEERNPLILWNILSEICKKNIEFKQNLEITLAGVVSQSITDHLNQTSFSRKVTYLDYISHEDVVQYQENSNVLLMILNKTNNAKWILPVKFFEYLVSGNSILCLGPRESDIYDIVKETNSGKLFEMNDKQGIENYILEKYTDYEKGNTNIQNSEITKYSREKLTKKLAIILNKIN